MSSLGQRAWEEQVRRLAHRRMLLDPVVSKLQRELVRAAFDGRDEAGYRGVVDRTAPILDRLDEHVGIGPRPR